MRTKFLAIAAVAVGAFATAPAFAQRMESGTGPVAASCQQDIEKLCADAVHGRGAVRACLERNKAKVSAACAHALETTGPGRGPGR